MYLSPSRRTAWAALAILSGSAFVTPAVTESAALEDQSALRAVTARLPGADPFTPALLHEFAAIRQARGSDYKPRTRHLMPDGWAKYTNRLFAESSPYLLQHAHNPVNWFPWGDEAFETARTLNRPVLLSVGYSTCHWCHVMEEESFEDEAIAKFLNENYVAIKVDREERPDVDAIYMSAVQLMTGRGGWPMTVWLKPDRKPYYGATYLPPRDGERGKSIGFLSHLEQLKVVYDTMPDRVSAHSEQLTAAIQVALNPKVGENLPAATSLHAAVNLCKQHFDPAFGGLKGAPKFPSSLPVRLLLNYYRRTGDPESLNIAVTTLNQMASGGIHDHVGGGFHRYSTDEKWLVPHFEKMLYDNALLTLAYLDAYQVTGEDHFADVVIDILDYVGRDMMSPTGAFYSATDADSQTPGGHQEEGYFYTWTPRELEESLGKERADIIRKYFAVSPQGNFEGRSILHTPYTSTEVAKQLDLTEEYVRAVIEESKVNLYRARSRRPLPFRDQKILTAWNALMISAYTRASFVLSNQEYLDSAVSAANFLLTHLFINDVLFRVYNEGKHKYEAYLDDYAFLTAALLDLYEVTHDTLWLERAIDVDSFLEQRYEDKTNGGYYMTGHDHQPLIAREKPSHDGALPSGNSVAILNLLRLYEVTSRDGYRRRADEALRSFSGILETNPLALSEMLLAVDYYLDSPKEIIIVRAAGGDDEAESLVAELRKRFLPNKIVIAATEGPSLQLHAKLVPLLEFKVARDGKSTAYVCEQGLCKLPTSDPQVFASQIMRIEELPAN